MNNCTPNTLLPVGTEVIVQGKKGIVENAKWETDQFNKSICSHTIGYTHTYISHKWVKLKKPYSSTCNYSFIRY